MSNERQTVGTDSSNTLNQTTQATPQELERNQMLFRNEQALNPGMLGTQQAGLSLMQGLLGGQNLPGWMSGMTSGISPDVTQSIVDQSIADIQPQMQMAGLLNSGVNASLSGQLSADIRNQAEQFNLQNKLALLQLGLTGQGQVQQPMVAQQQAFGGQLAGLRGLSQTGSSSGMQTTTSMNPFLKSFQESLGSTLGSGAFKIGNVFGWGA